MLVGVHNVAQASQDIVLVHQVIVIIWQVLVVRPYIVVRQGGHYQALLVIEVIHVIVVRQQLMALGVRGQQRQRRHHQVYRYKEKLVKMLIVLYQIRR
jgi:hypothetical protein